MELSVVICAHNPRMDYFSRVLGALRHQKLDKRKWELLVVDNASREPISVACDLSWHPHARHIREEQLGTAAARQRGIKEFKSDLLVFVDDDNVLASDYLSQALKISHEWPMLGVWGSGCIVPEFEVELPQHLKEFLSILVVRDIKRPRWSNTFPSVGLFWEVTPWGMGQCIRAEVAHAYSRAANQSELRITGHQGNIHLGGEDVEICFVACNLGWGMGIFPELRISHLIPKERVSDDYFLNVGEFTGTSQLLLEYKWQGVVPHNPLSLRGAVSAIRHAVIKRGFRRRMHFAGVKAAIRARKIINATQRQASR